MHLNLGPLVKLIIVAASNSRVVDIIFIASIVANLYKYRVIHHVCTPPYFL